MATKSLPLSKSVLTELTVEVVDKYVRSTKIKASFGAAGIDSMQSGDVNVSPEQVMTLNGVQKVVVLNSYTPFNLQLTNASGTINVRCNGLFLMYGSFDTVIVSVNPNETARVEYVYS